jgi:hypothetical protein
MEGRIMIWMTMACVALLAAAPAAAQTTELPLWLVGKWCMVRQEARICVRYDPPSGGTMRSTDTITQDGQETIIGTALTGIEDGMLVRHTMKPPGVLREVSQGPYELVMQRENPTSTQSLRMRYRVSGDELTVEFTNVEGEAPEVQRYTREPEGQR